MRVMKLTSSVRLGAIVVALVCCTTSCQKSLEERSEEESRDYTMRYCPTPPENNVITDSLVFDKKTKTQYYYLTFTDFLDDEEIMSEKKDEIAESLKKQTRLNPQTKSYKEAGFTFAYICRSQKTGKVLIDLKITKKDYTK